MLGEERDGKQRRQDGEGKARGAGVRWMSQGNGWLLVDCKRVGRDAGEGFGSGENYCVLAEKGEPIPGLKPFLQRSGRPGDPRLKPWASSLGLPRCKDRDNSRAGLPGCNGESGSGLSSEKNVKVKAASELGAFPKATG